MIGEALTFVRKSLDENLKNKFGLNESIVVLNSLIQQDGQNFQKNQNKMIITMINLEAETARQFYGGQHNQGASVAKINPDIRFNLLTLFAASFDNYDESLKILNATIKYFQANNSLDSQSNPDIPPGVGKLQFEIENIDSFQTHNLWSSMGAKYIPSIIYRIRHVNIQAQEIDTTVEEVKTAIVNVTPQ